MSQQLERAQSGSIAFALDDTYDTTADLARQFLAYTVESPTSFYVQRHSKGCFVVRCPSTRKPKPKVKQHRLGSAADLKGDALEQPPCPFRLASNTRADNRVAITDAVMGHAHYCTFTRNIRADAAKLRAVALLSTVATARPLGFKNNLQMEKKVTVSLRTARRLMKSAQVEVLGDYAESFSQIASLFQEFTKENPGTLGVVEREDADLPSPFARAFFCPGASRQTFAACRPIVCVDACHLRYHYQGVLINACVIDATGGIAHLCVAIAESETEASWAFFFRNMLAAIPEVGNPTVVFMHDRQKGLEEAQRTVLPDTLRSNCARHMKLNMVANDLGNCEKLFWNAASAYTVEEYNGIMAVIAEINPAAKFYLTVKTQEQYWARVHFPVPRYDMLTSNSAESVNAWLLEERALPFLGIFQAWIRKVAAQRWERLQEARACRTALPPAEMERISRMLRYAGDCNVEPYGDSYYGVHDLGMIRRLIVDFSTRNCECGVAREQQFPCKHLALVARSKGIDPVQLAGDAYHTKAWVAAYEAPMRPVDGRYLARDLVTLPPAFKSRKDARQKKRIESRGEAGSRRAADTRACRKCGETGHNKRSCDRRAAAAQVAAPQRRKRTTKNCENCGRAHYRKTPCAPPPAPVAAADQ